MPERKGYKKWLVVLIHALGWVALFTLPTLVRPEHEPGERDFMAEHKQAFQVMGYVLRVMWVGFFYLHSYVLMPRFAYRGKIIKYVASIIGVVIFLMGFSYLYFALIVDGFSFNLKNSLIFSVIPTLFLMIISATYKLTEDRLEAQQRARETVNENLKTELSLLRSQVSPHFMFNVLNNMVALARKKSDLLEPSLIKLSQLMRYMLYETEERVSIQREVEYLESYIDLQKQRFGSTVRIETSFDTGGSVYEIEPMLLIPFVENAFKHGVGMVENPQIIIDLKVKNDLLHFTVSNHYIENSEEVKDSASGIGLVNVNRRLKLLYPGEHTLDIKPANGNFEVDLQIHLA
jgi:two-component system, LytTR family, sensor kinase